MKHCTLPRPPLFPQSKSNIIVGDMGTWPKSSFLGNFSGEAKTDFRRRPFVHAADDIFPHVPLFLLNFLSSRKFGPRPLHAERIPQGHIENNFSHWRIHPPFHEQLVTISSGITKRMFCCISIRISASMQRFVYR